MSSTVRMSKRTLGERQMEFPAEALEAVDCEKGIRILDVVCQKVFVNDSFILRRHFGSSSHANTKESHDRNRQQQRILELQLKSIGVNETFVPREASRLKIMRTLLRHGAFKSIDGLRPILDHVGPCLGSRSTFQDRIPVLLKNELGIIRNQLKDRPFSIAFDGITWSAKMQIFVISFVDDEANMRSYLVHLELARSSWKAHDLLGSIMRLLHTIQASPSQLVSIIHDRAGENMELFKILQESIPTLIDCPCIPHTLNHVGEHLGARNVIEFTSLLRALSHDYDFTTMWLETFGVPFESYSETRWWSYYTFASSIFSNFAGLLNLFESMSQQGLKKETTSKILSYLRREKDRHLLRAEFAIFLDLGNPFVAATSELEKDGLSFLRVSFHMEGLIRFINDPYFPILSTIRPSISQVTDEEIENMTQSIVEPARVYFLQRFQEENGIYSKVMILGQAAELLNPAQVKESFVDTKKSLDMTKLKAFGFLTDADLVMIVREQHLYLTAVEKWPLGGSSDNDSRILIWWKMRKDIIPNLYKVAMRVFSLRPSSAAPERVFSMHKARFGSRQMDSLADYILLSLMLAYNDVPEELSLSGLEEDAQRGVAKALNVDD